MTVSRYTVSISGGGIAPSAAQTRESDSAEGFEVALPAGKAGTLSTRTDDDTGVITAAAHGLVVGDKVSVFWTGGRRYNMTVSAVAGNDVTVGTGAGEVGAGTVFPVVTTPVVITKEVQITISLDGDLLVLFGIKPAYTNSLATFKSHITYFDAGNAIIAHQDLNANQLVVIDVAGGNTNPFTGNPITYARAANGSSTDACTLQIMKAQDATP